MRNSRLYTQQKLVCGLQVELNSGPSRYASRALRLKAGDNLTLFNGDGYDYSAQMLKPGKTSLVEIISRRSNTGESPLQLTLVQGISRSEKMDLSLQKATELGVTEIQPVLCRRSIIRLNSERLEKKHQHWHAVICSACEQSGRSSIPGLAKSVSLSQYLNSLEADKNDRFLLDPKSTKRFDSITLKTNRCRLLIGPEGGFDQDEIEDAKESGFVPLSFGPRILRTETAGIAAIAVLQSRFGDLY